MDKFILSGKVIENPKCVFPQKQFDEYFVYLQTEFGDFSIGIDKLLSSSVFVGDLIKIEGQFLQKTVKICEKTYEICYLSANNIHKLEKDMHLNCVSFQANVNKQISICGNRSLISASIKEKNILVEIDYSNTSFFEKQILVSGALVPNYIDKFGLMEYIIKAKEILQLENYQERE